MTNKQNEMYEVIKDNFANKMFMFSSLKSILPGAGVSSLTALVKAGLVEVVYKSSGANVYRLHKELTPEEKEIMEAKGDVAYLEGEIQHLVNSNNYWRGVAEDRYEMDAHLCDDFYNSLLEKLTDELNRQKNYLEELMNKNGAF